MEIRQLQNPEILILRYTDGKGLIVYLLESIGTIYENLLAQWDKGADCREDRR